MCWCRFRGRLQVPEGSGELWCGGVGCGGRFWRVPVCAGVGTGGKVRKVPESYGVVCCFATLSGAAM